MTDFDRLIRKNIRKLRPYSTARDEFKGNARVFLDANENPHRDSHNRYPDPLQWDLKVQIGLLKGIDPSRIFLGNGSDEAIDTLIRCFCEPYSESVIITEPTYGMYEVCAAIHGAVIRNVPLDAHFDINVQGISDAVDASTKIIFLASPNNPTGNLLSADRIGELLKIFPGIVVIDEAYGDFSGAESFLTRLNQFERLVVLQTFSKAWGLAGVRLGMCFAHSELIAVLNKVKYPYNINTLSQAVAATALKDAKKVNDWIGLILKERTRLQKALAELRCVKHVYPTDANFFLVRMDHGRNAYRYLLGRGIIVRDRSSAPGCENCLRITVGTQEENTLLINALRSYEEGTLY